MQGQLYDKVLKQYCQLVCFSRQTEVKVFHEFWAAYETPKKIRQLEIGFFSRKKMEKNECRLKVKIEKFSKQRAQQ